MTNREDDDAMLSAAARSLHEEWDTPDLWPAIAARLREEEKASPAWTSAWTGWRSSIVSWRPALAAAALLALSVGTLSMWRTTQPAPSAEQKAAADQQLLTDDAVANIERAERQYERAIDELTRLAKPKLDMPDSPLIVSLRERLMTIDAAIDEYRMEIDKNRFNAHLREQLLWIYQEKRRTLEEVRESKGHAL